MQKLTPTVLQQRTILWLEEIRDETYTEFAAGWLRRQLEGARLATMQTQAALHRPACQIDAGTSHPWAPLQCQLESLSSLDMQRKCKAKLFSS